MNNQEFKQKIDECLENLKCGNNEALDTLYELTNRQLYVLCYSYFKNKEFSEDALFEAYLKIMQEIPKFKGKNGFAWIYTITKNICLNMLKKSKRYVCVSLDENNEETNFEEKTDNKLLELAKEILNDKEFRIVILHAVEQYKFKDIAKILNSIETTVRWQYNNALNKIRKEYSKRYDK